VAFPTFLLDLEVDSAMALKALEALVVEKSTVDVVVAAAAAAVAVPVMQRVSEHPRQQVGMDALLLSSVAFPNHQVMIVAVSEVADGLGLEVLLQE
jgi:hypothetical protein